MTPDGNTTPGETPGSEPVMETECMVCLTTMIEPSTLPCGHSFCVMCVRKFFELKRECMYCRAEVADDFKPTVNYELQREIREFAPKEYQD